MAANSDHSFAADRVLRGMPWNRIGTMITACPASAVDAALAKDPCTIDDLPALLSPAAAARLEDIAQRAHALALRRFGRTILLYAPLYVSNHCMNLCAYCGFNARNKMARHALTVDDAVRESMLLRAMGFRHLLLVSGQHENYAQTAYLAELSQRLRGMFASLSVEVKPLKTDEYELLAATGVTGVTCYQETYNPATYADVHQGGPKRDYDWRIGTLERAARAGMRTVGLSPLYGLDDWRVEALMTGHHAQFLMTRHWRTQISISFPRLRGAAGDFVPPHPLPDAGLAQLICAFRLVFPDAHLVLSTREPSALRDHLLPLGITQMSAASRTAPGGYSQTHDAGEQFDVMDQRSAAEVADAIRRAGYEPVWKDWDEAYLKSDI